MPQLLIDTDVFCKLTVCGLLSDAIGLLNAGISDCARLPALQHMLRKGKLRKLYGDQAADSMIPVAEQIANIPAPNTVWLNKLVQIQAIDPGEAQLFASAAESGLLVLTGDKRSLQALKSVADFPAALTGRIVVFEAILLALCDQLGPEVVRAKIQPLVTAENMVKSCFSAGNNDPQDCLLSYYRSLVAELAPLVLWNPRPGANP